MLRIACPHCGVRDHEEFGYFGDASKAYPPLGAEHRDGWIEAVFMRDNPRGVHREFWQHVSGCRRWLVVVLRAVHLIGVVGTGASLLGSLPDAQAEAFIALLLGSGVAMLFADAWSQRGYLHTRAGLAILIKLGLVTWFFLDPLRRITLFWIILIYTAIVAHAPARWRHRRWK